MEIILTALLSASAAASKDLLKEGAKDLYGWVKSRLSEKFADRQSARGALVDIESEPDDEGLRQTLRSALERAQVDRDQELVAKAKELLGLLRQDSLIGQTSYNAVLKGSGAMAQGSGARAVGEGGVMVEGNVSGGVRVGHRPSHKGREG